MEGSSMNTVTDNEAMALKKEKMKLYNQQYYLLHQTELQEKHRRHAELHKETYALQSKTWHAYHPERIKALRHRYYHKNSARYKVQRKIYIREHLQAIQEAKKAYRQSHLEQCQTYGRLYQQKHKAVLRAYHRIWRSTHPEKILEYNARRRARRLAAPINDFTVEQWGILKAAYRHRCAYCGKRSKKLTKDHILSLSHGGSHTLANIVPACASCNSKKWTKPPLIPVQPLLL
jgi:5-methylcytosine-specific restriction endonuclease McrA